MNFGPEDHVVGLERDSSGLRQLDALERSLRWHAMVGPANDELCCLAYADWLEENGRCEHAAGLRYMGKRNLRPHLRMRFQGHAGEPGRAVVHRFRWAWYRAGWREKLGRDAYDPTPPPVADVPRTVALSMMHTNAWHAYYPSWWHAVCHLASGLYLARVECSDQEGATR